jgi:hypothetical protein
VFGPSLLQMSRPYGVSAETVWPRFSERFGHIVKE